MAIDERADYATDDVLFYDDLNRWSINGSPQWLSETLITAESVQLFQNVFDMSATTNYSHFKIIIERMTGSTTGTLRLKLADDTTIPVIDYRFTRERVTYAGSRSTTLGVSGAGTAQFNLMQLDTSNESFGIIDVFNPNKAFRTQISAMLTEGTTTQGSVLVSGRNNNDDLYDGFELSASSGTITGRVTVYAWRDGSI